MGRLNFIDLFAGAGGLSEGFIRAGFHALAHVEADRAANFTLKTRTAYHFLKANNRLDIYESYLQGHITRSQFYSNVPSELLERVIEAKIGQENDRIFSHLDSWIGAESVDAIVGGPPCQAYSMLARSLLKDKHDDDRKTLYIHYGRFLKRYTPKMFVFENVPGLLTSEKGRYYKNLQKYYKGLGYEVKAELINMQEYGIIQKRTRLIIVGWREGLPLAFPSLKKAAGAFRRDQIFADLAKISSGHDKPLSDYSSPTNEYLEKYHIRNGHDWVTQHITRPQNEKDLTIYKLAIEYLENGERLKNNLIPEHLRTQKNITDFLDRFKVVGEEPHTMIAHIAKDGHHFIHPDKEQLRSISVREAARIQSFPDDFYFEGISEKQPRTAAFRQIGNAVPPVFSEQLATALKTMIHEL